MSRHPYLPLAGAIAAILMLGGCSSERAADASGERAEMAADSAPTSRAKSMSAPPPPPPSAPQRAAGEAITGPGVSADAMGSAAMTQTAGPRRFIRAAQVDCQVADVQRAALHIEDLASRFGGFVTRNDLQTDTGRVERRSIGNARLVELSTYTVRGELQVRIPSDRAQAFLRAIAAEMEFLDRRHFEAVDAQFELLRRQLARSRHEQAQAALGSAAADGGRLADRAEVIDRRVGQQTARDEALVEQRTFEDRVEFATLDVSMRQPERVRRAERPDVDAILRHEGPGFFNRLGEALTDGWRGMLALLVCAASIWPLWLAALITLLGVCAWRRRER